LRYKCRKIRRIVTKNRTKWRIFRNLSHYIFARNGCQGRSDQGVCEGDVKLPRNSVLELQKCKKFLGEFPQNPFLPKLSMRVPINHKKLYYNYSVFAFLQTSYGRSRLWDKLHIAHAMKLLGYIRRSTRSIKSTSIRKSMYLSSLFNSPHLASEVTP
jgi:hypothetical protein